MSDIYQKCSHCQGGKLSKYPFPRKLLTTIWLLLLLAPAAVLLYAGAQIVAKKLANQSLSLHDLCMVQAMVAGGVLALFGWIAYYEYNLLRHFKAWFTKICPYCENGFRLKNRVGLVRAVFYFFDIFLFEQILVPMYQALTLQMVWAPGKRPRAIWVLPKLAFYLFLFFGSIPFLVYLLGQNKMAGLVFSCLVVCFVIYIIFASSPNERSYQKSIVFLLVPLYYVSMVEIFRWTWVFSSGALTMLPDESDFLLMGLENLIRTQLFLDLFEVYDLRIGDIEAASFLSFSAIFVTRLILDIALISMLIGIAIKCYRRAWVFKFTGKKSEEITESEVLVQMENVAVLGSPRDIGKMQALLQQVTGVLHKIAPYVTSVARVAEDKTSKEAAERCSQVVKQLLPAESAGVASATTASPLRLRTRFAAVLFVAVWACAFTWGIQMFIHDVTQREIQQLMALAEKPEMKQNPLARQNLYLKVIKKDPNHRQALMASAATYLEMADLHAKMFDFDQTLIDIDKGFQQLIKLESVVGKGKPELLDMAAKAYVVRGKLFFLQKDYERAANELQKIRTEAYPDLLFTLRAYQAAQALYTPELAKAMETAERCLGNPKPEKTAVLSALRALHLAANQDAGFLRELEVAVSDNKLPSAELRSRFALCLGQALLRQGKENFAAAEKFVTLSLQEQPGGEASLALSFLYRLLGDSDKLMQTLQPLMADTSAVDVRLRAKLQLASWQWAQGKKDEALSLIRDTVAAHKLRDSLSKAVVDFLTGQGDPDTLLASAQSWNMATAERQKSVVTFYAGLRLLHEKKTSQAVELLRQCVFLGQRKQAEYYQARLELEALQIASEGRSYQRELFLDAVYLDTLSAALVKELGTVYTPKETSDALAFILGSEYPREKERALAAVNQREALAGEQYLPLLQKGLADADNAVKLAALEGLYKVGAAAKTLANEVIASLQNEDERVRRAAVKVMSRFGVEATPALEKALQDSDRYVRRDAAYALASLGEGARPALATLEAKLLDSEVFVRDAALAAIKEIKPEGGAVLARFLEKESSDAELRLLVLKHLEEHYPDLIAQSRKAVIQLLVKILMTSDDAQSSRYAAARLLSLGAEDEYMAATGVVPKIVERMQQSMQDTDVQRRLRAAMLFLKCYERWQQDPAAAFAVFLETWTRASAKESLQLVAALVHPDNVGKPVVELLVKAAGNDGEKVREIGWQGLESVMRSTAFANLAHPMCAAIVRELEAKNKAVEEKAPEFFKQCVAEDAKVGVPAMLPLLLHQEETVRTAAAQALQQEEMDYQPAEPEVEVLHQALNGAPELQKTVAEAVFQLKVKDEKLYPALSKLLDGDDLALCAAATKALCRYGDHKDELRPKLVAMLQRKEEAKPKNEGEGEGEGEKSDGGVAALHEAALFTLGVFDGLDALYKLCQKQPELLKTAVDVILPVRALLGEDDVKAVELFGKFLGSKNPEVVQSVLVEMDKVKDSCKPAVAALKKLQKGSPDEIRKPAHKLLLHLAPADYDSKTLIAMLADPDMRSAVLPVLTARGKEASTALTAVLACLEDEAVDVRQLAGQLLAQLGSPALPGLLKLCDNAKPEVRLAAVQAIGLMDAAQARGVLDKLLARLATASPEMAEALLEVTSRLVTPKERQLALSPLQQVAQAPGSSEKTKLFAWLSIAQMGYQSKALPELGRLLEESKDNHKLIAEVLQKIDAAFAANYLAQAIQQRYGKLNAVTAIQTLQTVTKQTPQSMQALEDASEDANPSIREAATTALQALRKQ